MKKPNAIKLCTDAAVYGALFLVGAYFLPRTLWIALKSGAIENAEYSELFFVVIGFGVVLWATAVMYIETARAIKELKNLFGKKTAA